MKARIEYPCNWVYKIIGSNRQELLRAIEDIIKSAPCTITHSSSSKTGKYHCLNLEMTVQSEEQRVAICDQLQKHPSIKIVL